MTIDLTSSTDAKLRSYSNPALENEQTTEEHISEEKEKIQLDYQLKSTKNNTANHVETAKNSTPPQQTLDHSLRFGWGPVTGACLQKLNNPLCFLICASFAALSQGFVVTGIAFGAITSIERQFGYTSSEMAMFQLAYEVAFGIMSLILGYFGSVHKPRFAALSLMVLAGGAVLIAIPKFVMGPYKAADDRPTDFCFVNTTSEATVEILEESCHLIEPMYYKVIFTIGFVLMGFGASPLWTLIPAHILEVTGRRSSSIYEGIYYGTSAIGPALGFIVGQPILDEWVDLNKPHKISLRPSHKNWVGAWWLGFLIGAGLILLPVIPLFAFPKEFPNTHILRKKREQAEDCAGRNENLRSDLRSVWPAFRALLTNAPYMFITLGLTSETLAVGGFSAFLAKFVHVQFHKTHGNSALYTGCMIIPGVVVGVKLGGYLLSRYNWDCRQILKFCTVIALVSSLCLIIVFVGCDGRRVVGQMDQSDVLADGSFSHNFSNTCNDVCGCTTQYYKPICSVEDQKTYYSPCHAGCLKNDSRELQKDTDYSGDEVKVYYNCSCFALNVTHAVDGACTEDCTLLPLFAVGMVITMLLTFLNNIPLLQATFRVANAGQGSFALGLGQVFMRFLGFVPGPFMFGALIDKSCELWQRDICSKETRNCLEYNQPNFRYYLFAGGIVLKMLSFIFIFLAYKTYRLPEKSTDKPAVNGEVNHAAEDDIVMQNNNETATETQ